MYGTTLNNKGKSEKNKKVKEGECIFPFKYKFNTHNECDKTEKGDICATSVNDHGTLQTYGYCVPFNKTKDSSATMKKSRFVKKTNTKKLKIVESIERFEPKKSNSPHSKSRTLKKGKTTHRKLNKKLVIKEDISPSMPTVNDSQSKSKMTQIYNEQFIAALGELEDYMQKKGEIMRARAYQKAQESIMTYQEDITDVNQIKDLKGIGKTIISKLNELKDTGMIQALETEKKNPIHIFTSIYGVGPKKAHELIKQGITSIEELKEKQLSVLTETQQMGLEYMEDINKRIPRNEIVEYNKEFTKMFDLIKDPDDTFEIVGSYRRGNTTSGDIDVIITDKLGKSTVLKKFIDKLVEEKIVVYKLTDGKSKILVIAKLPGKPARRVDFLFSPPQEFPFAILYFTGSKIFNTVMRQHALSMGYSLNEHGFYKMIDGKKGSKLDMTFKTENDIFDFLNMEYKKPNERKDGRSVIIKKDNFIEDIPEEGDFTIKTKKRSKSLKKSKMETPAHNIKVYRREGQKYIKTLSEREIGDMIRYANDMYYNNPDEVIMTDTQFDIIKEYLYRTYPKNTVLNEVGAPISTASKSKVVLPYNMPSMNKFKASTQAVLKWLELKDNSTPKEYVLSAKLDGVSGLFVAKNGDKQLFTRGNGTVGQDVSHLIHHLKFPKGDNIVIRGEFLISKDNFKKHFKDSKNPRNTIAGIINKINASSAELKHVDFVAYETIEPKLKPSMQLEFLKDKNIDIVKYEKATTVTNEILSEKLIDWRKNYKYEIDGIIVTHDRMRALRSTGNPTHAFAFKMVLSDQLVEANVVDVIWSPSKYGFLKPKIEVDPVEVGGVTIQYATAFNAAFVEKHKLGVGAVVLLQRSGDVIPHILEVLKPAHEANMPDLAWKWNETHVDIVLTNKISNKIVQAKIITDFFKNIGVEGLSGGNIQRIINAGYITIPQILALNKADFLKVDGFKDKLATKIYEGIKRQLEAADITTLIKASNIFGKGLGERKIRPILEKYPDILESNESTAYKQLLVGSVSGIGDVLAENFVNKIPQFLEFIKESKLTSKLKEGVEKIKYDGSHPLFEKRVVMTGFRDKALVEEINAKGGIIGTSVSKKTFVVLVPDKEEGTGKADEARKLKIPLMTPDEFRTKYLN